MRDHSLNFKFLNIFYYTSLLVHVSALWITEKIEPQQYSCIFQWSCIYKLASILTYLPHPVSIEEVSSSIQGQFLSSFFHPLEYFTPNPYLWLPLLFPSTSRWTRHHPIGIFRDKSTSLSCYSFFCYFPLRLLKEKLKHNISTFSPSNDLPHTSTWLLPPEWATPTP